MIIQENQSLFQIINHYGEDKQLIMAIEEMSELTKVLCKTERGKINLNDLTEEIADVMVMMEQLILIFKLDGILIRHKMRFKIERQLRRIFDENLSNS